MKRRILSLLSIFAVSVCSLFAADSKESAKENETGCGPKASCCTDGAKSKEAKESKAPAEKTAEPKKS